MGWPGASSGVIRGASLSVFIVDAALTPRSVQSSRDALSAPADAAFAPFSVSDSFMLFQTAD